MNAPVRRLSLVVAVLFASLLVSTTLIQYVFAADLNARPDNRRTLLSTFARERGEILVGQTPVAKSVPVDDEYKYQRVYDEGKLYAHVTGSYSFFGASGGLEQAENSLLSGSSDKLFYRRVSMGGVHTYLGQPAKSIPLLRTAMRLDPAAGYLYYLLLGRAYLFQGDVEQALINLREAAARNPADIETHLFLAAALVQGGNQRSAQWEVEEIRTLQPGFSLATWLAEYPLASEPLRQRLRSMLSQAGL